MRIMNKIVLLIVGALLVLSFGCSSNTTNTGTKTTTGAFIGGTKGLDLSFVSSAPPDSVFDTNYSFSVNVKAENVGEWNVPKENVTFTLTGINPSDFGVSAQNMTKHPQDDLNGAQKDPNGNVIQGGISNVEFNNLEYQSKVNGEVQFNLKAEASYQYGTKAQTQICVAKDLLGKNGEAGVCNPNGDKTVENSGAPIQIVSGASSSAFTESAIGNNKISFYFNIKNVDTDGSVYQHGSSCNPEVNHRNKVYVKVENPGLGQLSCSGLDGGQLEGYVTLYNGERSIRCTLTVDSDKLQDYEKVLNIVLTYDYKDSVEKSLIVKQGS